MMNFTKKNRLLSGALSIFIVCAFLLESEPCVGDIFVSATLAVPPGTQDPVVRRDAMAFQWIKDGRISFAETEADEALLAAGGQEGVRLLPRGRVLAPRRLMSDPLGLMRAVTREEIRVILQILAKEDPPEFTHLQDAVLARDDIRTAYEAAFPEDLVLGGCANDIRAAALCARAFELVLANEERLLEPDDLTGAERAFLALIEPLITDRRDAQSSVALWDRRTREMKVRVALANGFRPYEDSSAPQPGVSPAATPADDDGAASVQPGVRPSPSEIETGVRYWKGELATTPVTRPFRMSRKDDAVDMDAMSPVELDRLERLGAESVAGGKGFIGMLIGGASTRMNVERDMPDDVRAMAPGGAVMSKAAVPIGIDRRGEAVTYLDAFGENVQRLFTMIETEARHAGMCPRVWENRLGLMTSREYLREHHRLLSRKRYYGFGRSGVRLFPQRSGAIYVATPEDVELLRARGKIKDEEAYRKARAISEAAGERLRNGDREAVVLPDERQPLGHADYFHNLILSGELLEIVDSGRQWLTIKNVDNYAGKFDRQWLRILGLFLDRQLDFLMEVSPSSPGQKGASLLVMEDDGKLQLVEEPNMTMTGRARGAALDSTQSYWFNDAVAIMSPHYVISLYKKPGQTDEDFIRELAAADTPAAREAIVARASDRFPAVLDMKPAKKSDAVSVKRETCLWNSTWLLAPDIRIAAVGVCGARDFGIEQYLGLSHADRIRALERLRFLSTKSWTRTRQEIGDARRSLAAMLGRQPTENELWVTLETYEGNRLLAQDILNYVQEADLVTPGIFAPLAPGEQEEAERPFIDEMARNLFNLGYPLEISLVIIREHLRRLRQREPVDLSMPGWRTRLQFAVQWLLDERRERNYDRVFSNPFGAGPQRWVEIDTAADEFASLMRRAREETGGSFVVFSGGSGAGKSAIWEALERRYPGEFDKFLLYTIRPRRADEDGDFQNDIRKAPPGAAQDGLYAVLAYVLSGRAGEVKAVTARNVRAYRTGLLRALKRDGVVLDDRTRARLDKVLDLARLGTGGRRYKRALEKREWPSEQPWEISLAERLGYLENGDIRVYGEFDGVHYYFTTLPELERLALAKKVHIYWVDPELAQGVPIDDVDAAIADREKTGRITVLATTPAIAAALKETHGEAIRTFFVSPFPEFGSKKIAVIGASGFLGRKIYRTCRALYGAQVTGTRGFSGDPELVQLDVTREEAVKAFLEKERPDVVIYAAGEPSPDRTDADPARAYALNAGAVAYFGNYFSGRFIYISSDYVFDGSTPPYGKDAPVAPLNEYGRTKAAGEALTRQYFPASHLIVRPGALYGYNGPGDKVTYVKHIVDRLDDREEVAVDDEQVRYPVLIDDVARLVLAGIQQASIGTFQVAPEQGLTRLAWARLIAEVYAKVFPLAFGEDLQRWIVARPLADAGLSAARPMDPGLVSSVRVTPLRDGLAGIMRSLSRNFKGGSFSRTYKYTRDGRWYVRKEAFSDGRSKLANEIAWLLGLPENLRRLFPEVLSYTTEGETVAYEMPLYSWPTLTHWILDQGMTADEAEEKITAVLGIYAREFMVAPPGGVSREAAAYAGRYVEDFLIRKIVDRIEDTRRKAPDVFNRLIGEKFVTINGKRYRNILPLLDFIRSNPAALARLIPPLLGLFHGDLHFDNMLLEERTAAGDLALLDPRGDPLGDPVYDMAKIAHTVIGKYDMLNYDLHQTRADMSDDGISLSMRYAVRTPFWKVYGALEDHFDDILDASGVAGVLESRDPYWRERLSFTHASLFASDMPFHLKSDGREERALAIYAQGVILLNNYVADFIDPEILQAVDEEDRPTRLVGRKEAHQGDGIRHRTVGIIAVDRATGEIVLQKRSRTKDCFPGRIDILGGQVPGDDTYIRARDGIARTELFDGIPQDAFLRIGEEGSFAIDIYDEAGGGMNRENKTMFLLGLDRRQVNELKRKNEILKRFWQADAATQERAIREKAVELAKADAARFDSLEGIERRAYLNAAHDYFHKVEEYLFMDLDAAIAWYERDPAAFSDGFFSAFGDVLPDGQPNGRAAGYTARVREAIGRVAPAPAMPAASAAPAAGAAPADQPAATGTPAPHAETALPARALPKEEQFAASLSDMEAIVRGPLADPAHEIGLEVSTEAASGLSLVLYADDILGNVMAADLERTVREVLARQTVLAGGKIVIYAHDAANARILEHMIRRAGAGVEIMTIMRDELQTVEGEVKEARALLRALKARAAGEVLGIIKGPTEEPEELALLAKGARVPVVVAGPVRGVYSFAQAMALAIEAKKTGGAARGWLMMLLPVRPLTEEIRRRYEDYQRSLQALVAA